MEGDSLQSAVEGTQSFVKLLLKLVLKGILDFPSPTTLLEFAEYSLDV